MWFKRNIFLLLTLGLGLVLPAYGQLQLSSFSKVNTKCNGLGCNYNGPSILINEVMIRPFAGDGSIYGSGPNAPGPQAGEWIELYNPHLCQSVDISCFFLGNNTYDGNIYGGGFEIPPGTIVPPRGFCVVRGVNAEVVPPNLLVQNGGRTVEVVIGPSSDVCLDGGFRLWFPNAGGWFAFYSNEGIPQDAIAWNAFNTEDNHPCNPAGGCPYNGELSSYSQIQPDHKNYIFNTEPDSGLSITRQPDGGAWAINQSFLPTLGYANGTPIPAPVITCNGKASVAVTGGVPPYTFMWDDGQNQTNDTAVGLCEGSYCVTVTDAAATTGSACVTVLNFVPVVNMAAFDTICASAAPFVMNQGSPGGGLYSGNGVSGITFDPYVAGEGIHKVFYEYYTADSCYNTDSSLIVIYPGVSLSMPPEQEVCIDAAGFMLTAATPAGGTYSGRGVSNGFFNPAIAGPGPDTISYALSISAICTASANMIITVNPLPLMQFEPLPAVCEDSPPFFLSGGSPDGGTYSGNGVVNGLFSAASTGVGSFPISYAFVDEKGCYNDTTQKLQVANLPSIHAAADPAVICRGDSALISGSGAQQYNWFPMLTTANQMVVSPENTTLYQVIGMDAFGCKGSDSCTLTVVPLPELVLPAAVWLMTGEAVELNAYSGAFQYDWSNGAPDPRIEVNEPGFYWVKVADGFCTATDTIEVVEIPAVFVPNAFTPNDDGLNDVFGPRTDDGLGIRFWVFNRWGEQVFKSENLNKAWDGTCQSEKAPAAVYTWLLEWDFNHRTPHGNIISLHGKKSGSVFLIR